MRIPRIYSPQTLAENSTIELEQDASHHILNVLRMELGRPLKIFNGDGREFNALISAKNKKSAQLDIHSEIQTNTESPLKIQLAIGISKGERFEFVLQKSTELGVSSIVPLITERTEVKLKADRLDKKIKSWNRIIIGACEQSGRTRIPELTAPLNFSDFISKNQSGTKLVLHHRNSNALQTLERNESLTLLIGPEGGLSEKEILEANKNGFANVALGPRVLRTETAPIAALAILQQLWGDI